MRHKIAKASRSGLARRCSDGWMHLDLPRVRARELIVPKANLKPDDAFSFLGKPLVIERTEDKGSADTQGTDAPLACAVIRAD